MNSLNAWKVVVLKSIGIDNLCEEITKLGMTIQPAGKKALEEFRSCFISLNSKRQIDLVLMSVRDLGCGSVPGNEICGFALAKECLHPCSVEIVLQLRLQYENQPMGEYLRIPVITPQQKMIIFVLYNDEMNGMSLSAYDVRTSDREEPYYQFVFSK